MTIYKKDIEEVKKNWKTFSKRVMDHLETDPVCFYPAIKIF